MTPLIASLIISQVHLDGIDEAEADAAPLVLICPQRAPQRASPTGTGYGQVKFMGTPLAFAVSWTTSGEALYALVAAQLRGGQADAEAPPPHEAPVTEHLEEESNGISTGDDGAKVGADQPPAAPLARGAQWRLRYTSMTVGQLGQEPMGAVIPCTSALCEFGAPKLGSGTNRCDCSSSAATLASGGSSSGGSSSGGGSSGTSRPVAGGGGTSSLAARDDAPPPETRHVVLEWLPEAFEPLGSYDKAKLEGALGAGDANHRFGIQAGHKPPPLHACKCSPRRPLPTGMGSKRATSLRRKRTAPPWASTSCSVSNSSLARRPWMPTMHGTALSARNIAKRPRRSRCVRACANACVRPCSRACTRACTRARTRSAVAPQSPHMHPNLPTYIPISPHSSVYAAGAVLVPTRRPRDATETFLREPVAA